MALIQDVLHKAVMKNGSRIAFDSISQQTTYDQMWRRITHIAGALADLGIKKGERIGILADNCTDYIVYHYATAIIGAILLVLNTRHTEKELIWALDDAEASALVTGARFQPLLGSLAKQGGSIRFTIGIDSADKTSYSTDKLAEAHLEPIENPSLSNKDPILLIYTSGTTGRPKGALQTHEGSMIIDSLTAIALELCKDDVYLAFMPYFHQAGLIRSRAIMNCGGTNLVAGKFDAQSIVSYIVDKRVSITMLVPPYDKHLADIADRANLTFESLRYIIGAGGAGPIHAKRMRTFCHKFNCSYMGVYGQTETTGPITIITGEDYFSRPDSCGKPMQDIELQIWDENCKPLPHNTVGEIMIRSKTCIPGYWKNKQANRSLYTGAWLHTGDLAKVDKDGFIFFIDRKKELIKTGGENVYPREVEDVLSSHPAINELVVIGVPDTDGWGEKVVAVVVLNKGRTLNINDVKSHCQHSLAGYKIPKDIRIIDTLPLNHTGKIKKLDLKNIFAAVKA